MKLLDKSVILPFEGRERVLQFGEGNFLRGFVDYFIDVMNEKLDFNTKVVVAQPIAQGLADLINQQDGLYTLYLRGIEKGQKVERKRVIRSISRCINPYNDFSGFLANAANPDLRFIVSNTTEAGIVYRPEDRYDDAPQRSFPGKLTRFLHERFLRTGGETGKGLVILSCELIDNNGQELKKCVEQLTRDWQLDEAFSAWLDNENIFCSTLVDRIVTGYPRSEAARLNAENGYIDQLLDTAEVFGFWVIEGPASLAEELPFQKAGLPVIFTDDHTPYKKRKVRILNGAHTSMIMAAYLAGQDIVRKCMDDDVIRGFLTKCIFDEIMPTLDLPKEELTTFAHDVIDRFRNPYIDHPLLSIALNSTSKWKARVLPSVLAYVERFQKLPRLLVFSLAAYICFYQGERQPDGTLIGHRGEDSYEIKDDAFVLEFFGSAGDLSDDEIVRLVASNTDFWGIDLSLIEGLTEQVSADLKQIRSQGMYQTMQSLL